LEENKIENLKNISELPDILTNENIEEVK